MNQVRDVGDRNREQKRKTTQSKSSENGHADVSPLRGDRPAQPGPVDELSHALTHFAHTHVCDAGLC